MDMQIYYTLLVNFSHQLLGPDITSPHLANKLA
uniref:Uncharacterized protein n=1 Tax=Anguilla anguilla TaxID=7936 RepID=A0A0E9U6L0_ANGAN